ncbi:helix-turn-helix domain-containing protein, partial [Klebsiella pneumoniae]|uniref:helix-turn-helix domain-containing protein n=1 Tax=Klebsiella pneumoniae TaxID=573 RepID=UPI003EE340B3
MNNALYNQIRIFQSIAREGNISAAARKLEITPPSVSNALRLLEGHCCKVSDEAAFCLIQRPYI